VGAEPLDSRSSRRVDRHSAHRPTVEQRDQVGEPDVHLPAAVPPDRHLLAAKQCADAVDRHLRDSRRFHHVDLDHLVSHNSRPPFRKVAVASTACSHPCSPAPSNLCSPAPSTFCLPAALHHEGTRLLPLALERTRHLMKGTTSPLKGTGHLLLVTSVCVGTPRNQAARRSGLNSAGNSANWRMRTYGRCREFAE